MADTPKDVTVGDWARWSRDFAAKIAAAVPPPSAEAEQMAELAHKLAPHLEPLLGPSRSGMARALLPQVPFIPNPTPSCAHGGAKTLSWLSANEYIAAAATFIAGLLIGVLLKL